MVVDIPTFQIPGMATVAEMPAEDVSCKWATAIERAQCIRNLGEDWDGMGAEAPDPLHVDRCVALLEAVQRHGRLPPPDFVNAAPDGAVCAEWQWPNLRLEAEILDGGVEWMLFPSDGPSLFFETRW